MKKTNFLTASEYGSHHVLVWDHMTKQPAQLMCPHNVVLVINYVVLTHVKPYAMD